MDYGLRGSIGRMRYLQSEMMQGKPIIELEKGITDLQGEVRDDGTELKCPICAGASVHVEQAPNWGEWRKCNECTLEFANPRRLPERPEVLFDGAYRGERCVSAFYDFKKAMDRRRALISKPELWFWTPAYQDTLEWLKMHVAAGGTVLELGCGPGFFLHALRRAGFTAVGLDVAEVAVENSRRDGFRVWHGTLDTLPAEWVRPDAVVMFFMLHHLEDPLGLLRMIRTRWPAAPLALAQYGPGCRGDRDRGSPPRNLTRWNSNALAVAFRNAGYIPKVANLAGPRSERLLGPLRKAFRVTMAVPWLYRVNKRVERKLLPKLRPLRNEGEVVLAFGECPPEYIGASKVVTQNERSSAEPDGVLTDEES